MSKRRDEMRGSVMEYGVLWRETTLLGVSSNERVTSKQSATTRFFRGAEPELSDACHIMIITGRL
jgi:hypothetical protein